MNRQQILLALALREAGVALDVSTFDHRLILQKAVCILQFAGVNLGYRFRRYVHGPYSSELASDAFWLVDQGNAVPEELRGWRLDAESRQRVAKLKELFSQHPTHALAKQLELLGSTLFMVCTGQASGNAKEIEHMLRLNGKHFNEAEVTDALARLRQHDFTL